MLANGFKGHSRIDNMKAVIILLMIIGISAAGCALESFTKACNECSFDANGKMDKTCWEAIQKQGETCLATTYPSMSLKYAFGSCDQMDICASRLSACKEATKSGSDARDCNSQAMINCFIIADKCAEAANQVCSEGKTEEEAGFNNITIEENTTLENETDEKNETEITDEEEVEDFICSGMLFLMLGMLFLKKL